MKRVRIAIGLLLVIGSIAGLVYWETAGREAVLMDQVLVAKEAILPGTRATSELFEAAGVMEENKIEGALTPDEFIYISGKVAAQYIVKKGQIAEEYFIDSDQYLTSDKSLFVIKPEWISMRSSSLRRGDWVDIYEDKGYSLIGTYNVAFVKDGNEVEVRDSGQVKRQSVLDRTDSTSVISHIEIISDLRGYKKILDQVLNVTKAGLILVQKDEAVL